MSQFLVSAWQGWTPLVAALWLASVFLLVFSGRKYFGSRARERTAGLTSMREPFIEGRQSPATPAAEPVGTNHKAAHAFVATAHHILLPDPKTRYPEVGSDNGIKDGVLPISGIREHRNDDVANGSTALSEHSTASCTAGPYFSLAPDLAVAVSEDQAPSVVLPEQLRQEDAPTRAYAMPAAQQAAAPKVQQADAPEVRPAIAQEPNTADENIFDVVQTRITRDRASAQGLSELIRALYLDQSNFTFSTVAELDPEDRALAKGLVEAWLSDPKAFERWEELYETVREDYAARR